MDHFRPKVKFPEAVYEWSNWILACHDCNHVKSNKWPDVEYIDPCAELESLRPETYFTFDVMTGEMIPLSDLEPAHFERAVRMIDDLNLNGQHHLEIRRALIEQLNLTIPDDPMEETPAIGRLRGLLTSRASELSSLVRVWLTERGYSIDE